MENESTFLELYANNQVKKEDLEEFVKACTDKYPDKPIWERVGLSEDEYYDLTHKLRDLDFYVFKRKYKRDIQKLWVGCYVKFIYQMEPDTSKPHFEWGWVDVLDVKHELARLQCDDTFQGNRAVTVRTADIVEVLPLKERPLVFYKTMICGECKKCDEESDGFPRNCPKFNFFNAIKNKQKHDIEFIVEYYKLINDKCDCGGECHGNDCECKE